VTIENMTEVEKALSLAQRHEHLFPWGRVVWHVWGSGQGKKPLILLHGGSGSWTHWVRNVEHLSQFREIWALDIPGFGDSDLPPQARDGDDLVPWMEELLTHAFGSQSLTVLAFSFGAMVAGLMQAKSPTRFDRMMLVAPPGLGLFGPKLPLRGLLPDMSDLQKRRVHQYNLSLMMMHDAACVDDALIDIQMANVARDRLRRRRIASTDVLLAVQHLWTCRVDGIWGEQDALYRDKIEKIPATLPHLASLSILPNAGHWVMYEQPEAFHRVIENLLT
jgi:2-hydroxy-6-oxonona-2,4-dienedioate hydrolase